jgi:hypothetical protein
MVFEKVWWSKDKKGSISERVLDYGVMVMAAAHVLDSSLFNKLTDLSELENQIFK